jgi:hypothetical protein
MNTSGIGIAVPTLHAPASAPVRPPRCPCPNPVDIRHPTAVTNIDGRRCHPDIVLCRPGNTAGIKATRDLPSVARTRARNCGRHAVDIAGRHVSVDIAQTGMPARPMADISALEAPRRYRQAGGESISAIPGCRGIRYRYRIHGVRPDIDAVARARLIRYRRHPTCNRPADIAGCRRMSGEPGVRRCPIPVLHAGAGRGRTGRGGIPVHRIPDPRRRRDRDQGRTGSPKPDGTTINTGKPDQQHSSHPTPKQAS